jgi:hypothetical protein
MHRHRQSQPQPCHCYRTLLPYFTNPPVSGRGVNLRSIWVDLVTFDANLHVIGGNLIPKVTLKRLPQLRLYCIRGMCGF